jgi:hypothetical protein
MPHSMVLKVSATGVNFGAAVVGRTSQYGCAVRLIHEPNLGTKTFQRPERVELYRGVFSQKRLNGIKDDLELMGHPKGR